MLAFLPSPGAWVVLMVLAVPLDFRIPLRGIPPISVIDGLCVLACLSWIFQTPPGSIRKMLNHFPISLTAWASFLIFGCAAVFLTDGHAKGILRWMEFLAFFLLSSYAARESDQFKIRYRMSLILLSGALGGLGLWQFYRSGMRYEAVCGLFGQHNIQGAFLALVMPVCFAEAWRKRRGAGWLILILALAALGAFLGTYSRGSWMGVAGGIVLLAAAKSGWFRNGLEQTTATVMIFVALLVAGAFPLAFAHYFPDTGLMDQWTTPGPDGLPPDKPGPPEPRRIVNPSQRTAYWRAAYNVISVRPWLGLGPGRYVPELRSHLDERPRRLYDFELRVKKRPDFWQHLHSAYLQVLVEYGVPGFILWALALALLTGPAWSSLLRSSEPFAWACGVSILAFLIHNSVDYLFVNSLDLIFACHLAMSQIHDASRPPTL